jgi:TRAP-type mannitol/chloroaromatic compound transport system permease small subunit
MPVETWRAVRAHSWLLLDLVENGGAQAVMRYLDSRGLEWFS